MKCLGAGVAVLVALAAGCSDGDVPNEQATPTTSTSAAITTTTTTEPPPTVSRQPLVVELLDGVRNERKVSGESCGTWNTDDTAWRVDIRVEALLRTVEDPVLQPGEPSTRLSQTDIAEWFHYHSDWIDPDDDGTWSVTFQLAQPRFYVYARCDARLDGDFGGFVYEVARVRGGEITTVDTD